MLLSVDTPNVRRRGVSSIFSHLAVRLTVPSTVRVVPKVGFLSPAIGSNDLRASSKLVTFFNFMSVVVAIAI